MEHLDVVADLVARLPCPCGCPVAAARPKAAPPELVTVSREGGRWLDGLRDRAGVGLYCWAPTEHRAAALAARAAGAMARLRFADGYDSVEMESMRSDPDPDTRGPRWYLSYTIVTHKPM